MRTTYKLIPFLLFCILMGGNMQAQQTELRYRIRGKIIDSRTKKEIQKIPILVMPMKRTVNADNKGAFLFGMPKGKYSFVLDDYPFTKEEVKVDLHSDTTLVIELHTIPGINYLGDVEVVSSRPSVEKPAAIERIDKREFKTLPALIGERDILKAFGLTAGVTSSSEGAADMQVRGGLHGQNLYLLDGIPLYSTEHFFGLISAYNPTIIKSATLYKSDFPTEYGGKISSVVNVENEDADSKKFKAEAEIGLLTSKLALNIPLVKNKVALSVAGRISNYSIVDIVSPLLSEESGIRFGLHFADLNANLVWKLSETDKLKLTFLSNSDGINVNGKDYDTKRKTWIDNSQTNLGLNWYKSISEKADNQLLLYADKFGYDIGTSSDYVSTNEKYMTQVMTDINSVGLVDKFNYKFSDKLNLNAGLSFKSYGFAPFKYISTDSTVNAAKPTDQVRMLEGVVFAEGNYQLAKDQNLKVGLRLSTIGNKDKTFTSLEPRIGYRGIFANNYSISASVGRMSQPIHRVANSGLGFPFEIFYPSSSVLKPEGSWNFSLGGAKDFSWKNKKLSLKVDAWYKTLENMVEFQDGYDVSTVVFSSISGGQAITLPGNTGKFVTQGNGKAYGIDFSASYNTQRFRLTADYTLMKATCQFDQLNDGRPFAAPTDIRNSLSLTSEVKLSDSWTFSATWQYHTGKPITIPTQIFMTPVNYDASSSFYGNDAFQQVVTERNNYRTKPFHRLDVSFTHNYKTLRKHLDASISLGLYNVYNQANPFMYYVNGEYQPGTNTYYPVLKSMSLFPILPSFSWSLKF